MRGLALAFLCSLGCSFSGAGLGDGGDGGDGGDSGSDGADGQMPCEAWGVRAFFDACADLPLSIGALDISADSVFDTDSGEIDGDGDERGSLVMLGGQMVRLIHVDSFRIRNNRSFRIVGSASFAVASEGILEVEGTLDGSSFYSTSTAQFDVGAGADPPSCPPTDQDAGSGGLEGDTATEGGGGGGGGGFGTEGGDGGNGRDGSGASGGPLAEQRGLELRGGCPGGRGGEGEDQSGMTADHVAGVGGPGGGAILLSSTSAMQISGTIHAGGAGGRGQIAGHRHAGGGGGSGGLIALEGPTITVMANAIMAANGGGGGGGANNEVDAASSTGGDAEASASAALGALGEDLNPRGTGGAGGVLGGDPNNLDGALGDRGGGGGGGGLGHILLISGGTVTVSASATVSPEQVEITAADILP